MAGLFAAQVHPGSCCVHFWLVSDGTSPWLSGTVSCVISNVIWWHTSSWYCPFSSCHSVQMCLQINWFPSGFTFQGLHVIEMQPKPRGLLLMDHGSSQAVTYNMLQSSALIFVKFNPYWSARQKATNLIISNTKNITGKFSSWRHVRVYISNCKIINISELRLTTERIPTEMDLFV